MQTTVPDWVTPDVWVICHFQQTEKYWRIHNQPRSQKHRRVQNEIDNKGGQQDGFIDGVVVPVPAGSN